MYTHELIILLREHYPNIKWLRRTLGRIRVRIMKSHLLPEDLAVECERNEELKRHTVVTYKKKWKRVLDQDIKRMKEILRAEYGRIDEKAYTDIVFCRLAYGFTPDEYVQFNLVGKPYEQRCTFVSDLDRYIFAYHMSDISDLQVFHDKSKTYEHFARFYKRDLVSIRINGDETKYMAFVRKHPVFVKKDALGMAGHGVELVDINKCGKTPEEFFAGILKEGWTVLEERIIQGEEMARFNHSSINTVRCIALTTRHGVVTPYCLLRTGRNGSFVDNASSGGLLAHIDSETGIISSDGFDRNNVIYEVHPDTGIRFKGFQLPEWDDMLATVRQMMQVLPSVKYVGWDMAHTNRGWVMIEGNCMAQLMGPQSLKETGIREEMLGYMKDMDLMVPLKNNSL